jgi:hypothetical protein
LIWLLLENFTGEYRVHQVSPLERRYHNENVVVFEVLQEKDMINTANVFCVVDIDIISSGENVPILGSTTILLVQAMSE